MTSVRLLPATVEYLLALQSDPAAFGLLIGSAVPAGPEFPESIGFSIERLRDHGRAHDEDDAGGAVCGLQK